MTKSIFLSYRRSDSLNEAFWLHTELSKILANTKVFIDEKGLQAGDKWADSIESNLKISSVLIAVIGPDWLRAQDEHFRRRLDIPSDWVRREIEFAITNNLLIIPLLVSEAKLPDNEGLPDSLLPLTSYQSFALRSQNLTEDTNSLLKILEQHGFERISGIDDSNLAFPSPGCQPATPLSEQEIDQELNILTQWKKGSRKLKLGTSIDLTRSYEFETFESAMHFMMVASRRFSTINHHPTWQNTWRTITIWLTTWDNGLKPSSYDIDLAKYLDSLYLDYEPRETQMTLRIDQELLSKIDLLVEQGLFSNRNLALQSSVQESLRSLNRK